MSIHQYFKPVNGLPDPKGLLSASISTAAIASANQDVQKVIGNYEKKKRGPYKKYVVHTLVTDY